MNAEIKKKLILRMAKAMHKGFWSGTRPHEKRLITMAGYAFNALECCEAGRQFLGNIEQQMNLLEYEDQPRLPF